MDYFLTEEQQMIKDLARRIADEKIAPRALELDETGEFPWDLMKVIADADLFGVYLPEEYGGLGGGVFEQCLVVEELSRACSGVAVSYAASGLGCMPILVLGSEEQKGNTSRISLPENDWPLLPPPKPMPAVTRPEWKLRLCWTATIMC